MPIRKYNPTSPGRRFQTVQTFDDITTTEPHKPLVEPLKRTGGRSNHGDITSWWRGGQIARSAGSGVQVVAKEGEYASVKMPSGETRKINVECYATVGQVGNLDHENVSIGKAGRSRWLGQRPHVRGVAMNPVDHPLGGGEGKTSGGRHPVTPWGQPTKGYKTRNNKSTDKFIVQRRKK